MVYAASNDAWAGNAIVSTLDASLHSLLDQYEHLSDIAALKGDERMVALLEAPHAPLSMKRKRAFERDM